MQAGGGRIPDNLKGRALAGFWAAVLFLVLLPQHVSAGGASIQLQLDRQEATLEDTVTLRVKVSGVTSVDQEPKIQGLENLSVVAGGTSTRIEIINFSKTEYIEYLYYIQAKKAGTYRIGPAEVRDRGVIYRSSTATLTVRDAASSQGQAGVEAQGPLFLRAELSKSSVYADEPTVYTLKLYRTVKVSNVSLDIPDNPKLTLKKLGDPIEYRSVISGETYEVLEIRYELTAAAKGRYRLPPATMAMTVYLSEQRGRGWPFNDPYFSMAAPRPKTVGSNPLELNVHPLPQEGRPADFTSLIGQYTLTSRLDRNAIAAGETATLTVKVEGRGSVNKIPDLSVPDIPGVRIYPDQPSLQTEADAAGSRGVKTMKWAFVPEKAGVYQIPPLSLSYFDTAARAYRVLRTPNLTLTVRPGAAGQGTQPAQAGSPQGTAPRKTRTEVVEVGKDILPVHTGVSDLRAGGSLPSPAVLWLLLLAPPLALAGAWMVRKKMNPSREQGEQLKMRGALKAFLKASSSGRGSADELLGAVRGYFNSRFGSSLGTLTPGEAGEILDEAGVDAGVRDKCVALLEELTGRVYTGQGGAAFEHADELLAVMRKIDRQGR